MPAALILISLVSGGLGATLAVALMGAGIAGAALGYWLGGMAGATVLILWAALRPEADETPCPATGTLATARA